MEQRACGAVRLLVLRDHRPPGGGARAEASGRGRRRPPADGSLPGRGLAERPLRPGVRLPVVRGSDRGAVDRDRLPAPDPRPRPAAVRHRDTPSPLRRPRLLRALSPGEGRPDQGSRLHVHGLGGHVQPRRHAADRLAAHPEPARHQRQHPPRNRPARRGRRSLRRLTPESGEQPVCARRHAAAGRRHRMAQPVGQGHPERHRPQAARALSRSR